MIKVLEHGIKKVTCPCCRAKLQYELEDIQEGEYLYIVCPDCENKIELTPTKR